MNPIISFTSFGLPRKKFVLSTKIVFLPNIYLIISIAVYKFYLLNISFFGFGISFLGLYNPDISSKKATNFKPSEKSVAKSYISISRLFKYKLT